MEVTTWDVFATSKRFGSFQAVDGVSFEVLGPTSACAARPPGSGKSTILRVIAGLNRRTPGG